MLKAYQVGCRVDDHGAVIKFAERAKDVSRYANSMNCDCDFIDRTVLRAPKFDDAAPGPLTPKDYIDRGWYWGCSGCSEEQIMEYDGPLYIGGHVFCGIECVQKCHDDNADLIAGGRAHESIVSVWTLARDYLDSLGVPTKKDKEVPNG